MGLLVRSAPGTGAEGSSTEETVWLFQEHTFGRSAQCGTVLDRVAVSRVHARVSWNGTGWTLRDLASRNGTYVNGRRVPEGRIIELEEGDRILFGDMHAEYRLVEADAPRSFLLEEAPDGATRRILLHSIVTLPSPDSPRCTVFCGRGDEFALERESGGIETLEHGMRFDVDGYRYSVVLAFHPDQSPQTASSGLEAIGEDLEILVSPDEESAEVVVRRPGERQIFAPKAHFYLLAYLARVRLEQASTGGLGERDDDGWVDCETICRDLRINREHLAQQVFRIRQELKQASPELAERVVDRRLRGRMRFGIPPRQFLVGSMA